MSFDRLAPGYDWMEKVLAGKKLHACRTAYLNDLNVPTLLLLGEGHGQFLRELLKCPGPRSIVCLDSSSGMLAVAKRKIGSDPRVKFQVEDVFSFTPAHPFHAVTTHFFLDCFTREQHDVLLPRIHSWLLPGGLWHIADFQVPRPWFRCVRAKLVLAMAYAFFRVATRLPARRIIPPQPTLQSLGMALLDRHEFNFGLLYSELWQKSTNA